MIDRTCLFPVDSPHASENKRALTVRDVVSLATAWSIECSGCCVICPLMRMIDEQYTACLFYGSRRMTEWLTQQGEEVNRKRVQRLMRTMGLEAIYPKPRLSTAGQGHKIYPYLLRDVTIERADQVWSTDITYVPLTGGFMYLAAVIDWYSRYVIAWRLSNTLDGSFCLEMLEEALRSGKPEVFNTDQGVQFTAEAFTGCLESAA